MMMYYVPGDPMRYVSPDVFVVRGIPRLPERSVYKTWEEGPPELVVELTSKKTRKEDITTKFALYRDVLRVREYILFDPFAEYLKPPLQGYRLVGTDYVPIEPVEGRLPSEVLGLHFAPAGERIPMYVSKSGKTLIGARLRLHDPATGDWILLHREAEARAEAEAERDRAGRLRAEAEADRLRRELVDLKRSLGGD